MNALAFLRWLHVIGAAVLLGTGLGIAFFMVMAHRTRDAALIAHTARTVVMADYLFTATAVVGQPITGALLVEMAGWGWERGWLRVSIGLYVLTGLFWLPVVWMQSRMRDLARVAVNDSTNLPPLYYKLYRLWFACGIPAFVAVLAIVWLMLTKPEISLPL